MLSRFREVEEILYTKHSLVKKNGIQHIVNLLNKMGNPHKMIGRVIHITGTNGKGSVAYLSSMALLSCGKKVGVYTSPHVRSLTERIKINGKNISEEDFVRLYDYVVSFDKNLSFFEILTLIMINYFAEQKVDFSVIEVGIGGLYDTTNVVNGELCFITSIDYDHMDMLGPTLNDIAFQKAGIIKNNSVCIVGEVGDEQFDIIKKVGLERNATVLKAASFFNIEGLDNNFKMILKDTRNLKRFKMLPIGIKQPLNLSMVIKGLELIGVDINLERFYNMIENTNIDGRFQIIKIAASNKTVILDGAHNVGAVEGLVENFHFFGLDKERWTLLFSILSTKDYKAIVKKLASSMLFDRIIITSVNSPKRLSPYLIADIFTECKADLDISVVDDSKIAFELALKNSDRICITGSFYLVSEILTFLSEKNMI